VIGKSFDECDHSFDENVDECYCSFGKHVVDECQCSSDVFALMSRSRITSRVHAATSIDVGEFNAR
jgi:hypothetical protein